jgi:hypothetical protein
MKLKLSLVIFMGLLAFAACSSKNEESKAKSSSPAVSSAAVAPLETYDATLSEGIQFAQNPGYPKFIKSVSGMSHYEKIGRWTEGPKAIFTFVNPLPVAFKLHLEMKGAFGPNEGKPIKVIVGDWQGSFVLTSGDIKLIDLMVKTSKPSDTIEFMIPEPVSPAELKVGSDPRLLGIMFERLSIQAE